MATFITVLIYFFCPSPAVLAVANEFIIISALNMGLSFKRPETPISGYSVLIKP
jgi:hypothetical protein